MKRPEVSLENTMGEKRRDKKKKTFARPSRAKLISQPDRSCPGTYINGGGIIPIRGEKANVFEWRFSPILAIVFSKRSVGGWNTSLTSKRSRALATEPPRASLPPVVISSGRQFIDCSSRR